MVEDGAENVGSEYGRQTYQQFGGLARVGSRMSMAVM
jgi:hypothetical protein